MTKKILAVDDDHDFLEAVSNLLTAKGYQVITEDNGKNGFHRAQTEKPDLMLLDVMMPQADGFDIARHIHEDAVTKTIPVIIITGIRRQMGVAFKFEPDDIWLPVKAVLEKPVKPELLLKAVEESFAQ